MKSHLVRNLAVGVLTLAVLGGIHAEGGRDSKGGHDDEHVLVTPSSLKWGPGPPALPPGAQAAVLVGDPSKAGGAYTIRAKMPDGYQVPAHWHPADENVTVLQGTLL